MSPSARSGSGRAPPRAAHPATAACPADRDGPAPAPSRRGSNAGPPRGPRVRRPPPRRCGLRRIAARARCLCRDGPPSGHGRRGCVARRHPSWVMWGPQRATTLVAMSERPTAAASAVSRRAFLLPLALAQFICSFAGSNMNVMINDITDDLNTTVAGVQATITLFLLIMAVLMIPCSKLTDRWGRKRCFTIGLVLYGIGALLSAVSPGLGVLILGNSVLEGVGTALLIPPVYILTTLRFSDTTSRARAFGVISGLGGLGAAAGPLIGGLITTAISWRAAFIFQALVVAAIVVLSRRVDDPVPADPTRPFDAVGAVLSAVGMFFVVFGIRKADNDLALMAGLLAAGAAFLIAFFLYTRARERAGKQPLLPTSLFKNH